MAMETPDFIERYVESFRNFVATAAMEDGHTIDMSDAATVNLVDLAGRLSLAHFTTLAEQHSADQIMVAVIARIAHGMEHAR